MPRQLSVLLILALGVVLGCQGRPEILVVSAPAGNDYVTIEPGGRTVLPNGRVVTPLGRAVTVAPHPYGLALSADGHVAVTANSGTSPLSISIIRDVQGARPTVQQVPPGPATDEGVLASVFMGLAISPDGGVVYVAGGQENVVFLFDVDTGQKLGSVDCSVSPEGLNTPWGYVGDMVLSRDGKRLYAVDQTRFRMIVIDTQARRLIHSVPVGRYPFGITLSPDETRAYVANVGMFEYRKIPGVGGWDDPDAGLDFPPFGHLSQEAREGTRVGALDVPGLGDPNVPESFSVWTVDLTGPGSPVVTAKTKTGVLVGEPVEGIPAVGGSSPNSLVATSSYVFVSNGNNDTISVIDSETDELVTHIRLTLHDAVTHLRGIIPFGLAVSPDGRRLFVAESGINAVAVIDVPSLRLLGHLPVGWFPAKLQVSPDGRRLIVANAKGLGSGPNGGSSFQEGPEGSYIGSLMKGTVSVFDIPTDSQIEALTARVVANNFRLEAASSVSSRRRDDNPVPLYGGQRRSPIEHIVFISKENRTFDEVFGQLEGVDGDPSLARYGRDVSFASKDGQKQVEQATVMPNHLALAARFAIADNFYVDADVSADGHRWLVNTYPNEWVETTSAASYGGNREFERDSTAPGSLGMTGSAGAIYPEDYNEAGSMWEHLERHGVSFFNFGFGIMFEPASYHESFKYTGVRHLVNFPVPAPIFHRTSKTYPTYNMAIPDQFRASQFIEEFSERWLGKGETLPQLLTVILPNDHGAQERPEAGYPFRESYMADNDLALGRIVEFLSRTPYWERMAIVVTEDDAQDGVDHVDAHRSLLMLLSPYARRGYVSHVHYSFGSIFKTFWNLLGLPYLNQYDAGATDLADMFVAQPDRAPYSALAVDPRIFDPQKALTPLDEDFDWQALAESPVIDDPRDMMEARSKVP